MADFNRCMDCTFAKWDKTAAGRLHPSGQGRCTWTKSVALPASMTEREAGGVKRELERAHYLNRTYPIARCDTFVRAEAPAMTEA